MKVKDITITQTKDGSPIRIYAIDGGGDYPIHGAVFLDKEWISWIWDIYGNDGISLAKSLDLHDWEKDIPWECLQDWIKFVAMDADGKWIGYEETPITGTVNWITRGFYCSLQSVKMPAHSNWRGSVVARPE